MAEVAGRTAQILRENWLLLLVVAAVAIVFAALRTPASDVASLAEVEAVLEDGQPTLVEFYSNT